MPTHPLSVWMNGQRVGTWTRSHGGAHRFQYEPSWLESPAARVLSLSLPFTPQNQPHTGAVVASYFENLLPDSDAIRVRLQQRFRTDTASAFDLLTAIGRDCVGAVQLLPDGNIPIGWDRIEAEPLDEAEIEKTINAALVARHVLGQTMEEEFRISLAGAQEKTALLRHQGRWCRPRGATPTTHIFKLPLGLVGNLRADLKDSVENEWLCLELLRHAGLPAAKAEICNFGARKVLVVERFDRLTMGDWIARLPQEDLCQALGLPPDKKYESDGGPTMANIMQILQGGNQPADDTRVFVTTQLVFWLLAATDGHAKNYSLFHDRGGGYRMTPIYDVLSAWPIIGTGPQQIPWQKTTLALSVRGKGPHRKLAEIRRRHWTALFSSARIANPDPLIEDTCAKVEAALTSVGDALPAGFPQPLAEKIMGGVRQQIRLLRQDS